MPSNGCCPIGKFIDHRSEVSVVENMRPYIEHGNLLFIGRSNQKHWSRTLNFSESIPNTTTKAIKTLTSGMSSFKMSTQCAPRFAAPLIVIS